MSINSAYLLKLCDDADEALEAARDNDDATMQGLLGSLTGSARTLTNLHGGAKAWGRLEAKCPGARAAFGAFLTAAGELYAVWFLPLARVPLCRHPGWLDDLEAATKALRDVLAPPTATACPDENEADPFRPMSWFTNETVIKPTSLRTAANNPERKTKRVRVHVRDCAKYYSVEDARRIWPSDMHRRGEKGKG